MRRKRLVLTGSALSSRVSQWTQRGLVKSIQRGTITVTVTTSVTATITAVSLPNTRVRWLGQTYSATGTVQDQAMARVELTDATTVTAYVNTNPGGNITIVSFEVVEYWPGVIKSVQRGTISGSTTATVTAVDVNKSELDFLGYTQSGADGWMSYQPRLVLTNATTITQTVVTSAATVGGYQLIEMY